MEINTVEKQAEFALKSVNHIITIQKKISDIIENGKSSKYSFEDLRKDSEHISKVIYILKNGSLNNFEEDDDNAKFDVDRLMHFLNTKLNI